jgi:hypothetical protein
VGRAHDKFDILDRQAREGRREAILNLINLHVFAELAHGSSVRVSNGFVNWSWQPVHRFRRAES